MVQVAQERIEARRREILRAASEVFRQRGFHAAGMRDIAGALGIAVGKLYYWFANKQELLAFCQEDCLNALLKSADRANHLDADAAERLWHLVAGHVWCLNRTSPGSLAHLEVESLEPPRRQAILKLRDRYELRIRRLIAEASEAGLVRPEVDAKVSALCVLGAANWTVKWYRSGGRLSLETIAAEFADQLVRGLLVRPEAFVRPDSSPLMGGGSDD